VDHRTLQILAVVAMFGGPLLIGAAWWRWRRDERTRHRPWRAAMLVVALATLSCNLAVFWASGLLRWRIGHGTDAAWVVYEVAGAISGLLISIGLVASLLGQGNGRLLALVAAALAFVLWMPVPLF
jgi:hypothetical protein